MRLRKSFAGITLVTVLAVGCGGSSGQKVTIDATPAAMRKSAEATLTKGTAKLELTMEMSVLNQVATLHGTGAMDPAHKRFQLDLDAKDLLNKLASTNETVPPDVASAFGQPLTEIIDGTVFYMHFPVAAKVAGNGKEWFKFDLASVDSAFGDLLQSGAGASFGSDPAAFLQFLEGAGKVDKVGEEDVRGTTTTHFSGSYTRRDALAALPEDQRDKVENAFAALGISSSGEDQEIPFDAWVGDDGLVRRVQTTFDTATFGMSAPPNSGKVTVTLELFDFGTPVDITIPSDDQVNDVSSGLASKFSSVASSIGN